MDDLVKQRLRLKLEALHRKAATRAVEEPVQLERKLIKKPVPQTLTPRQPVAKPLPPKPTAVAPKLQPVVRSLPCIHEGDVLDPCKSCAGELGHVRECDLHTKCTRGNTKKGFAVCATCTDYEPDPALLPPK